MRGRHVGRDERAAVRGARERVLPHAVPALVVLRVVVLPELLVLDGMLLVDEQGAELGPLVVTHGATITTAARRAPGRSGSRLRGPRVGEGPDASECRP